MNLSESDKRFEEINKIADDMMFRIRNMNDQLDICVIRVGQLEERIDQVYLLFTNE